MQAQQVQFNVMKNAESMSAALSDLTSWESSMNTKDKEIAGKKKHTLKKKLPPVRNAGFTQKVDVDDKTGRTEDAVTHSKKVKEPASHTYDNYKKWETIDVDAEPSSPKKGDLEELSNLMGGVEDTESAKSVSSSTSPPSAPTRKDPKPKTQSQDTELSAEKIERAQILKDKGNAFFKKGKFQSAVDAYTESLRVDRYSKAAAPVLSNRAMAQLRLSRPAEAEADAQAAIGLDPTYLKAFSRRGQARLALGKIDDAVADFGYILTQQPDDKTTKADLQKARQRQKEREQEVEAKPRRRRLVIQEVDEDSDDESVSEPGVQAGISKEKTSAGAIEKDQKTEKSPKSNSLHPASPHTSPKKVKPSSPKGPGASSTPASGEPSLSPKHEAPTIVAEKLDTKNITEAKATSTSPRQKPTSSSKPSDCTKPNQGATQRKRESAAAAVKRGQEVAAAAAAVKVPTQPPKSSFEFERAYQHLKGDDVAFGEYLELIKPSALPAVLKQSFDADILLQILRGLQQVVLPKDPFIVLDYLKELPKANRFDMTMMFLSKKDKGLLKGLVEDVSNCCVGMEKEVAILHSKYKL